MASYLDDKFSIDSDKHNFYNSLFLHGKKEILHYFPNLKLLANFIVGYKLRMFIVKGDVDLLKNSSATPSYSSLIEDSARKLA
ncbi:hypothetical protein, partial [Candidatus Pseudothioglobus singularis]|uniref:hypothetical protein n=1 Tax=Candidatus Pseudothioglobus singularis TaxID=1427364 RepID=UPI001BFFD68A